jgi:undecaprenyl-diphosphatase
MTLTGAGSVLSVIQRSDFALMRRVHHWPAPGWVRTVMVLASRCGDGWFWYALGFLILAAGDGSRFAAVCAGTSACGAGLGIYVLVKKATRRKRPCLVEPHAWARILPPDQYSFPSGHTIAAFASAVSVGHFYPALLLPLVLCAALIGTSRILLGMHFLSDVLVGAVAGTSLGYTAFVVFREMTAK